MLRLTQCYGSTCEAVGGLWREVARPWGAWRLEQLAIAGICEKSGLVENVLRILNWTMFISIFLSLFCILLFIFMFSASVYSGE